MPRIEFALEVDAPVERVFDLARSVEAHLASTEGTGETLVAGPRGLLELGDEVTWEARHLGLRRRLTARITEMDRPAHFRDSMVRGAFRRFDHDHWFEDLGGRTVAREAFDYDSPFGALGRLADLLFLEAYMRRFLFDRAKAIQRMAESEGWRSYLPSE